MDERLRLVPLFAGLPDDDLERICGGVTSVFLEPGEVLFREGERGDSAYVVVAGEVDITKDIGQRTSLLAKRGSGDVIGEMALLSDEPRIATVQARTAAELLTISKSVMDQVLSTSPSALRSVFTTLLDRLRETNDRLRSSERMVQLGTLTAGVAHELNNPAAGARRAAEELGAAVDDLIATVPQAAELGAAAADLLAVARDLEPPRLGALERVDAEAAVEQWLDTRGVADAWQWGPALVGAGLTPDLLDKATAAVPAAALGQAVQLLARTAAPRRLARDVAEGTRRISELVGRLKSHAYLDRAAVQEVDVRQGLDDTLMLLGHKLRGIEVVRDEQDVPVITAAGAELNQVWMNLLDNAADALTSSATPSPRIVLRTTRTAAGISVEVEDNGPGIPSETVDRVFDAFFTTKPPGSGTGLGLNLSYQIVVFDHGGELTVTSAPGRTIFRVGLPLGKAQPGESRSSD